MLRIFVCVLIVGTVIVDSQSQGNDVNSMPISQPTQPVAPFYFSYLYQEVVCQKVNDLNNLYASFDYFYFPRPTLNVSPGNGQPDRCFLYLMNHVKLDLEFYWNASALIEAFSEVIKSFVRVKYCKTFTISVDSFAHSPLTQSFVFFDVERLENNDQVCPDEKSFTTYMSNLFLSSLINKNIRLTESDLKKLENFGANTDSFPKDKICDYKKIKINILDQSIFSEYHQGDNVLTIGYSIAKESSTLSIVLNQEYKSILLTGKEVQPILHLCKRGENSDDCETITMPEALQGYNFFVDPTLRYDIEIQESSFKTDSNPSSMVSVYEIFIIFVKKDITPGFIPNKVLVLEKQSYQRYRYQDDIFICQSNNESVTIGFFKDDETKALTFSLGSKSLKNLIEEPIYQMIPSSLKIRFKACEKPNTRIFHLKPNKKRFVIITEDEKGNNYPIIKSVKSISSTVKGKIIVTKECPQNDSNTYFEFKDNLMDFVHGNQKVKYTHDVVLRYEHDVNKDIDLHCVEIDLEKKLILKFKVDEEAKNNFKFNFNLGMSPDENLKDESIVYLSKSKKLDFGFEFSALYHPVRDYDVVFVSIVKESQEKEFSIQAVFYNKKSELFDIQYNNGKELTFKTFPKGLMINEENSSLFSNHANYQFEELTVVYLSETEVVYKLKIHEFSNCRASLRIEKITGVRIYCENIFKNGPKKIQEDSVTRKGLRRILGQAKPTTPNQNRFII